MPAPLTGPTEEALHKIVAARQNAQVALRFALEAWHSAPPHVQARASWRCEQRRLKAAAEALGFAISLEVGGSPTVDQGVARRVASALDRRVAHHEEEIAAIGQNCMELAR